MPLSAIFQQPVLVVEEAGNTQRESQTMGKQLVNFFRNQNEMQLMVTDHQWIERHLKASLSIL
jgi:hypothetical protein